MTLTISPGPHTATAPAIPVRDAAGGRLPPDLIRWYVSQVMAEARRNGASYRIDPRGWGYPVDVVAPMFDYAPLNIALPWEWYR